MAIELRMPTWHRFSDYDYDYDYDNDNDNDCVRFLPVSDALLEGNRLRIQPIDPFHQFGQPLLAPSR
jgi:hypothetical protein